MGYVAHPGLKHSTLESNKVERSFEKLHPYLENRLRIRPVGVVSKKLIGDLNIAKAIRSWSFREACEIQNYLH